jgi:hypothetical protein
MGLVNLMVSISGLILRSLTSRTVEPCMEETWDDFWRRRAEEEKAMEKSETWEDRNRRKERTRSAQRYMCPGESRTDARMFEWFDGKRMSVRRGELAERWTLYTPIQLRYSPFHNEWDANKQLSPDETVEIEAVDISDDENDPPPNFNTYVTLSLGGVHATPVSYGETVSLARPKM